MKSLSQDKPSDQFDRVYLMIIMINMMSAQAIVVADLEEIDINRLLTISDSEFTANIEQF